MTGYTSKKATAQEKLKLAHEALGFVMSHGPSVQKAKDILSEALEKPALWVPLTTKEILTIIDQQEAYTQTGLPMFYRDQCLEMARMIETKLKERNA